MTKVKSAMIAAIVSTAFISCSDDDSTPNNNPNQPATASFTWTENGGATITADSAFYVTQYKTIKAFKGANMAHFIEINLSADSPATYQIGGANAVSKLDASGLYAASAGSIIITQKDNQKMSGSVTSTGSGSNVTALNAQFTNIEVR